MIVKTANLLSRADAARWVQYKLDRGLDHVLVDEAQDTSPRQWSVIKALAEEFFAGEGAGAGDAHALCRRRRETVDLLLPGRGSGLVCPHVQRELRQPAPAPAASAWPMSRSISRSARRQTVLSAVDAVFDLPAARAGVTSGDDWPLHEAFRRNDPGRVVVWPLIEPPTTAEPSDWTTPLDHLDDKSPEVQLAERIAADDRRLAGKRRDACRQATGSRSGPRDILIL